VWFDAPIGYISATKEWALREGKDWEPYWKDQETKLVHSLGRTILFSLRDFFSDVESRRKFILPDNVPANEF
jgi:methionyl-tRNA synthetase